MWTNYKHQQIVMKKRNHTVKQNRSSNVRFISSFLAFLLIGLLIYRFDRGAIWFAAGLMLLLSIIIEKVERDIDSTDLIPGLLIVITLVMTGVIQIVSGVTAQALFLRITTYTFYHLAVHLIWLMLWLILTLLDFTGSRGRWSLAKLSKSVVKTACKLFPFATLPVILQLQHLTG